MRKFVTWMAAASIAGGVIGAAPARADQNDIAKVIVGLAGVAALATIINSRNKKREASRAKAVHQERIVPPKRQQRHVRQQIDYQQCLRQRWTNAGWETFVSNRCVNKLQREAGHGRGHGRGQLARR